jgi:glyoxylase-like metal-dependent hydrolase (beta-lactamase superfamily II)
VPGVRIRWEPEEVAPGLFRLSLPYPAGSSVNVLLIPSPDGVLLVDAGYASEEAWSTFEAQLDRLGLRPADVRAILVTHADEDHVGFARRLHEESGAKVMVHRLELDRGPLWKGSAAWLYANGYDGPELPAWPDPPGLPDSVQLVDGGMLINWAGFGFRLIHCPGHTPGLVCAYDERRRLLLSTDHLLRAPTPVGLFSDAGDPLGDYLQSLERLRGLEADLILPGHGRAFTGLTQWLDTSRDAVAHNLARIWAELGQGPGTAWEIARRLRPDGEPRMRIYAAYMVLAGLRHLERTGQAAALEVEGVISYRAT